MPVLKKQPIGTVVKNQLPPEVVDEYKAYIEDLIEGEEGLLEFSEGEDISQARKALHQAAEQIGTYLKISKVRGRANLLRFQIISKKEFEEAQVRAKARGEKLKGKPKPKRKAKAKAK